MSEFRYCQNDDDACESVIVQKVFDECRFQKCIEIGPVISAEKCTCIIVSRDEDESPGRVVLPDRPVYLPETVCKAKVISDSFTTEKVQITGVTPSQAKKGYWDIEAVFTFVFKVQLYDVNMNKFKIRCCPPDCQSLKDCRHFKDYILCSADYLFSVTLYGSEKDTFVTVSGMNQQFSENDPCVYLESKAYYIDICLKSPDDICFYKDILDSIYDEPIIYLYVKVGLCLIAKIFRHVNLRIKACGYDLAKPCGECQASPCEWFNQAGFPMDQFFPPVKDWPDKENE